MKVSVVVAPPPVGVNLYFIATDVACMSALTKQITSLGPFGIIEPSTGALITGATAANALPFANAVKNSAKNGIINFRRHTTLTSRPTCNKCWPLPKRWPRTSAVLTRYILLSPTMVTDKHFNPRIGLKREKRTKKKPAICKRGASNNYAQSALTRITETVRRSDATSPRSQAGAWERGLVATLSSSREPRRRC